MIELTWSGARDFRETILYRPGRWRWRDPQQYLYVDGYAGAGLWLLLPRNRKWPSCASRRLKTAWDEAGSQLRNKTEVLAEGVEELVRKKGAWEELSERRVAHDTEVSEVGRYVGCGRAGGRV
ncbi:MAG: hypothetical protein WCD63_20450 [Terrimicrobiaceae bacterium]